MLRTKYIVLALPLVILVSTFLLLVLFLLLVHYGLVFSFNSKATIFPTFDGYKLYLYVFLFSGMNFIIDYFIKSYNVYFCDGIVSKFEKMKVTKKENKQLLSKGHISNSKIIKNVGLSNKLIKTENLYKDKGMESSDIVLLNNNYSSGNRRKSKYDPKRFSNFSMAINNTKSEVMNEAKKRIKSKYLDDSTNLKVSQFKTGQKNKNS